MPPRSSRGPGALSLALALLLVLGAASCRRGSPAVPATGAPSGRDPAASPSANPALTDVALSSITGGYRVCAPRNLHACRARAVTSHGAVSFPPTDIAASPSCAGQEQRATEQCAGAGSKPYDPANLACLARLGILNALLDDHRGSPAGSGDEPKRLTLRCEEGVASIDLLASL